MIGPHNVCRKTVEVEALETDHLELEGHRLEILPRVMGDMRYNSMVWIPSIKTLYAMAERFPRADLLHLSNEMNANVFKGGRDWHWREEE